MIYGKQALVNIIEDNPGCSVIIEEIWMNEKVSWKIKSHPRGDCPFDGLSFNSFEASCQWKEDRIIASGESWEIFDALNEIRKRCDNGNN